jgi:DNA adenine methylase
MTNDPIFKIPEIRNQIMAEPVLKWAGGKRQILPTILAHFREEEEMNWYHEPFFGGGAVFFRETYEHTHTINDINTRLMNFYRTLQQNTEDLLDEFSSIRERMPEDEPDPALDYDKVDEHGREIKNYYYQLRAIFNKRPNEKEFDKIREAAILLWLNRTCFNGLYRENASGEFNVPVGNHKNLGLDMDGKIRQAADALQCSDINIFNQDFSYVEQYAESGDLVYFDPPYDPNSSSSSFVEYTSESFGKSEQRQLRDLAVRLHNNSVDVVISNAPSVTELYEADEVPDGFDHSDVGARRAINSDGESRGEVNEVIITNIREENRRYTDAHIPDYT